MARKPTIEEVEQAIRAVQTMGLDDAVVKMVSERNHLIYRIESKGNVFVLRMINPTSYRRKEWIMMAEEYAILRAIGHTSLGPRVYFLDEQHEPPFLVQEFVHATCFNELKPLTDEHLAATARAIAMLNAIDLTPERLPFLSKYVRRDYAGSGLVWYYRLADSIRRMPRRDVLRWVFKVLPLIPRTMAVLARSALLLPQRSTFHFDGAHCGNTYWRDGRVMFLDWQKVSLRNDPTFTLVRFATSVGYKGVVPEGVWQTLIEAYLAVRSVPDFGELALVRLLERQTADLVWVLWDAARQRRRPPETGLAPRYAAVKEMLRNMR